jgi:hypothetical protein
LLSLPNRLFFKDIWCACVCVCVCALLCVLCCWTCCCPSLIYLKKALQVVSARPRLKRHILRNKISGSGFDTYISGAMHVRDLLGGLVLFLLLAEASRNWSWIAQLSRVQNQEIAESQSVEEVQALIPPLCQSAEPVCKEGFTVTCKTGNHSGCDCNYIHLCHPNVSECFQTNVSHTKSCGF